MNDERVPSEQTIGFRGRVDRALAEEFADYFPQFGSNTWFINTMLELFLAKVRENPSMRKVMEEEIDRWFAEWRKKGHTSE